MADAKFLRVLGHPFLTAGPFSFTGYAMTSNTHRMAYIFQAAEAATITHLGVRVQSIAGTSPAYKLSLQSVTNDGLPAGSDIASGSSGVFTPASAVWTWVALTTPYACTQGKLLALAIEYSSGTINAGAAATFTDSLSPLASGTWTRPYTCQTSSGAYSKVTSNHQFPVFAYKSASKTYGHPVSAASSSSDVNTQGHRIGMKFSLPVNMGATYKIAGCRWGGQSFGSNASKTSIGLYSGTTLLQTFELENDAQRSSATNGACSEFWSTDTPVDLTFGQSYYIVAIRNNARVNMAYVGVASAADLTAYSNGMEAHMVFWFGSSWDEYTALRPCVELILSDITPAAGGSGISRGRLVNA